MSVLYLCYQSVLEPLTRTQVIPYLEGLTEAGYRIVLMTFEPYRLSTTEIRRQRRHLAAKNITWHCCRYHKRPTAIATAWDVAVGVLVGLRLIRKHRVRLLHARVHTAGAIALVLKRLTGARLLFDVRGLMAEEYADAGVWPADGLLFRLTKRIERLLVEAADGVVVLSEKAKGLLLQWYPQETADKPLAVIPCCVDLRACPGTLPSPSGRGAGGEGGGMKAVADNDPHPGPLPEGEGTIGRSSGLPGAGTTMVYIGKLDGWYPTDAMAGLMATAVRMFPRLRWQVWTQSNPRRLRESLADRGINGQVTVGTIAPDMMPEVLSRTDAGLSFREPGLSALAASPTKIGEYLAAGLPVIANPGVGDTDALLEGKPAEGRPPVGVTVRDFTEEAYRGALSRLAGLLADPDTPDRCRDVARRHLDLVGVGWARYRQMYDTLIGIPRGT